MSVRHSKCLPSAPPKRGKKWSQTNRVSAPISSARSHVSRICATSPCCGRTVTPTRITRKTYLRGVPGGAAAEEPQLGVSRGGDLVPGARGNQDRVARPDGGALAVDLHLALTGEHVVELLAVRVVVRL